MSGPNTRKGIRGRDKSPRSERPFPLRPSHSLFIAQLHRSGWPVRARHCACAQPSPRSSPLNGGEGGPDRAKANPEAATSHVTQVPRALTNPRIEYVRAPGRRLSRRWLGGSISIRLFRRTGLRCLRWDKSRRGGTRQFHSAGNNSRQKRQWQVGEVKQSNITKYHMPPSIRSALLLCLLVERACVSCPAFL